jgi:hypothetical protein
MAGRKQTDHEQDVALLRFHMEGLNATEIHAKMLKDGYFYPPHRSLTVRAVQMRVKNLAPPDPSGPWSFLDADDDEPPLIFDVLLHMHRLSHGRMWLSKQIAGIVARLRRADPHIPPHWAYVMATMYQQTQARDGDVASLDLVTALAPWRRMGPVSSWVVYALPSTLRGPTDRQGEDFDALVKFLTELAIGFSVVLPAPPEES